MKSTTNDELGNPKYVANDYQIRFHVNEQVITLSYITPEGGLPPYLLLMQGFGLVKLDQEQATALAAWAANALPQPAAPVVYHCSACQKPLAFTAAHFAGHLAYCDDHQPELAQESEVE